MKDWTMPQNRLGAAAAGDADHVSIAVAAERRAVPIAPSSVEPASFAQRLADEAHAEDPERWDGLS